MTTDQSYIEQDRETKRKSLVLLQDVPAHLRGPDERVGLHGGGPVPPAPPSLPAAAVDVPQEELGAVAAAVAVAVAAVFSAEDADRPHLFSRK